MPRNQTNKQSLVLALSDISEGGHRWRLWSTLGWNDIKQRYRRSLIGPLWLTASMGIMVISLGIIYSKIFNVDVPNFMPYLSVGLLIWGFVNSILSEAGTLFIGVESYIKQVRLPFSVYIFRFIWCRLIIFAHNFLVYLAVIVYFNINPGLTAFIAVLGLFFLTLNGILVSLYLGMISARFRDIPQIVASGTQIVFFLTPIMWKPEFLGSSSLVIRLNPFFHLIEIVRGPLLGYLPSLENWIAVIAITGANAAFASVFFPKYRSRIPYWV